jgi:hypothetical protein
MTNTKSLYYQ